MKGWSALSLQTKLSICLTLASLILVVFSTLLLLGAVENNNRANKIAEISQCTEPLFSMIEALAFERGRTNVVLNAEAAISDANRSFIDARRKQVDENIVIALERIKRLDPKLADNLTAYYDSFQKLRDQADREAKLTLVERDRAFTEKWFMQSTDFIFIINDAIEALGKQERADDLFDLHQHFQLDCLEFRIYSGYSASVLTAALGKSGVMTPDEYREYIAAKAKADYIWTSINKDAEAFGNQQLLNQINLVFHKYYEVYRPYQEELVKLKLAGRVPEHATNQLAALSVPAFDSIFILIGEVSAENHNYVAAKKQKAANQLMLALTGFLLLMAFVVFTVGYFRVRLFSPLRRIINYLKIVVTGQTAPPDLEADAVRGDEIGLLTQGVKMLQISMQEERRLKFLNETMALTDQLTGLFNRQMLEQEIIRSIAQADRYGEAFSMIIFDLDHFKRVNDTWGHPVGDDVLRQTAKLVKEVMRGADSFIRLGGEEFIILMPQTGADGAVAAAEKIRLVLEKARHPLAGQVTASFGVAERRAGEAFADWYKRADEAMYRAKNYGRNRVVCFRQDDAPVASVHLVWRQEWESGNPEIDLQHRRLLERASEFFDTVLAAQIEPEKAIPLLEQLLTEVGFHFAWEEKILAEIGYPNIEEHRAIHKQLLDKATTLKQCYIRGEIKASALISFTLDDVVVGHMFKDDQLFFPYTRKG